MLACLWVSRRNGSLHSSAGIAPCVHRPIAGSNRLLRFEEGTHDVENPLQLICQSYLRISQERGIRVRSLPSRGQAACKKIRVKLEISCWDLMGNCSAMCKQLCRRIRSKNTRKKKNKNKPELVLLVLISILKTVRWIIIS